MTTRILASIVQIAGAAAIAAGVGLLNVEAGIVVGGVEAVVFGVALELAGRPATPPALGPPDDEMIR